MKRTIFNVLEVMTLAPPKCWICGEPTTWVAYLSLADRKGLPCCKEHTEGRIAA